MTGEQAAFARTIGIDYSGAETANSSLKGLRVYMADLGDAPHEIDPPPSPKRYWTRRGIAEWLVERLAEDVPTVVGIDHAFSFPLRYFEVHGLLPDWPSFLDDFQKHWPTDADHTYVDFVRYGTAGNGSARGGNPRWRRLTEERSPGAKSVFHFDVQGSVAKSTHAGFPGFALSGRRWQSASTSGLSMAGMLRLANQWYSRSTQKSGVRASLLKTEQPISTTPTAWQLGSRKPH
jgi:hypothetical protein